MRARREIGVGFGGGKLRYTSSDAHLAVDFAPIKYQGGMWIQGQLPPLAALIIGEEKEAPLIDSLEQNHSRRRAAAASTCRERHRIWFQQPGAFDCAKPAVELLNGITVEGALGKARWLCQTPVYALSGKLEVQWKR